MKHVAGTFVKWRPRRWPKRRNGKDTQKQAQAAAVSARDQVEDQVRMSPFVQESQACLELITDWVWWQ
jgi:hypothetical protein